MDNGGPLCSASWSQRSVEGGPPLLMVAGGAQLGAERSATPYYYVPQFPQLAVDRSGDPVFALTVLLSQQPAPQDDDISSLIQQGILSLSLTLAVPAATALKPGSGDFRPLFAREAVFRFIENGVELPGSTGSASGSDARVALSFNLTQAQTVTVLAALAGQPSSISVAASVAYRCQGERVTLAGSWAKVYDFLSARMDPVEGTDRASLQRYFASMLDSGTIQNRVGDSTTPISDLGVDWQQAFSTFVPMASPILMRSTPELDTRDPRNRYTLRGRPDDQFQFQFQLASLGNRLAKVELSGPLEKVLGGALDGRDRDRFIRIIGPAGATGPGFTAAPQRRRMGRNLMPSRLPIAAIDGRLESAPVALKPSPMAPQPAAAVVASDIAIEGGPLPGGERHFPTDDIVLDDPENPLQNLPVIDDPGAPLWHDRANPNTYWYAPAFSVIQPAPSDDPASSAFEFVYAQSGATDTGKIGLDGTIRLTLQTGISDATRAALAKLGNPEAHPLPLGDLSVSLAVPFRDSADGTTKAHPFVATFDQAGNTVTFTIKLLDDWVRLAYGALASPNFQSQPTRVVVNYAYDGYVLTRGIGLGLGYGPKFAHVPLVMSQIEARKVQDRAYFDARDASYQSSSGQVRFQREAPRDPAAPPPSVSRAMPLVVRPGLENSEELGNLMQRTHFAVRRFVRQFTTDVLFPCNTLGALYLRSDSSGLTAIGCQDALQLGQTTYKLYEEIVALRQPLYQVYRSLQQPGLFLVVPNAYRITRFEPSDPTKAYRPTVLVYASVDTKTPANNRYIFSAALMPAIPPYVRRALRAKLEAYAQNPILEYPTELASEPTYTWAIPAGIRVDVQAVKTPDSIQMTLSTDLPGALILQSMLKTSGIFGNVNFTLADHSTIQAALELDLTKIEGPSQAGPLQATLQDGTLTLTNQISASVNVTDAMLYGTSGPGIAVSVDATLAIGGSKSVAIADGSGSDVFAAYTIKPGDVASLTEIRSFVEDVHCNVLFLDLVNFANHALQAFNVVAKIKDVDGTYPLTFGNPAVAGSSGKPPPAVQTIDMVLPLTSYLQNRLLQYQVTKTYTDGSADMTPWIEQNLDVDGNVVSLIWDGPKGIGQSLGTPGG